MIREDFPLNPSCLGARSRFEFHENRALVWLTSLSSAPTPGAEHRGGICRHGHVSTQSQMTFAFTMKVQSNRGERLCCSPGRSLPLYCSHSEALGVKMYLFFYKIK